MINKVVMIAVVGRANVGKSSLTNLLTGEKVAIVTPKPQTTRNRIFGVFSQGETQVILLDTPGFHKARTRLGQHMVGIVKESIADVDAAALIVEPVDNIGTQEELLIGQLSKSGIPTILVINKIDTIKVEQILPVIESYSRYFTFESILPVSVKTGDGIPQLLEEFLKYAKESRQLFPDDMATDQQEKQIIAEIIREKLLLCLDKEIPHGTAVEITKFSEREVSRKSEEERIIIDVDATIYCEKASHKGMIIGKNGVMLKKIGQLARADIESFMGAGVFLQTWVKVKENWRDNQTMLRNLGYN